MDNIIHYGTTLRLYFYLLIALSIFFGAIAIIYAFLAFINISGGYLNTDTMETYLDYISIANFYGYANMTTNDDAKNWHSNYD